jgi:hypothetical protein
MAHILGKFVWFELLTSDVTAAKRFYGELLGWTIASVDMGGGEYTMITNGEAPLGGVVKEAKARPQWISYLSVDDVDGAAKRVVKNGGKLTGEAVTMPTVGRFARVTDPQGGAFFLFRAEKDDQPDRPASRGDWLWNELWAKDGAGASAFYTKTFGFTSSAMPMPNGDYHILEASGGKRGGIMTSPAPEVPVSWLPYVQVDDVDGTAARAEKLGGSIMSKPEDIPNVGRFAIVLDPQGAAIAVMKPTGPM